MTSSAETNQLKKYAPQARWREKNPSRVWAQAALRSALKRGLVEQLPCASCGNEKSEAHHPDYSRPAEVVWYCRRCHQNEHRRLKAEGC